MWCGRRAIAAQEGGDMTITRAGRVFGMAVLASAVCISVASANGFNLNGVGSKAIGMGGAFIGLADDPSAVFWNPAGLTQTSRPTLYGFEMNLIPTGTYRWQYAALGVNIDAKTESRIYPVGALGYFRPVGKKWVVGLAGYVPAGTGATWDGAQLGSYPGVRGVDYKWESFLAVMSAGPVVAYRASDKVSVGATVVANRAMLQLKRPGVGQYDEDLVAWALGATLGVHARPSEKVAFGLTFRTPSKLKFSGDASMSGTSAIVAPLTTALGIKSVPTTSSAKREATWPLWVGAGVAVKPTSKLTFTGDVQLTNWKKVGVVPATFGDPAWLAVRNAPAALKQHPQLGATVSALSGAFNQDFILSWKDAVQVRFGAEYALDKTWALRAGYYYDPSPSPVETLNILLPEGTYHTLTLGLGAKTGHLTFDACFEALFGRDAESPVAGFPATVKMPGTHGVRILAPNVSVSYGF
jgi:long-chain fatty acid transport protein